MTNSIWPALESQTLSPTIETLHLWSQIAGKARLTATPWENHGWHVPLYLSAKGITTGLIAVPGHSYSLEFNLAQGAFNVVSTRMGEHSFALGSLSTSEFLGQVAEALKKIGVELTINTVPSEIVDAPRYELDRVRRPFDIHVARTYWCALLEVRRVFQMFRTRFVGKHSPIHLFWGAFDLAMTRFSGRSAPPHPGGIPRLSDAVTSEAYSHELSSAGFWPNLGHDEGPAFYSYAYPSPVGFDKAAIEPSSARYDKTLGEFVLPYRAVAQSADPDTTLLGFLDTTYRAASVPGRWEHNALERSPGRIGIPPTIDAPL